MGYGRGHAMRTRAVLPSLMEHYDVRVFAGGDAYEAMHEDFPVTRIPSLGYKYDGNGGISVGETIKMNAKLLSKLLLGGERADFLRDEFKLWQPDVVVSDSEVWTHRTAQRLKIPRISFDHVGIIAYCLPPLPQHQWFQGHRDGIGYRALMGVPERILICSFYTALPREKGIEFCGPMIRDEVLAAQPSYGDYLLAYFNKGEHQFLPHVEKALQAMPLPVVVYGAGREGEDGNLLFKKPGNLPFIKDLAGCRAVLSTAGNQLIGEAIHFRKPLLVVPEEAFEQQLNTYMVRRLGIGRETSFKTLCVDDVELLLDNEQAYRDACARQLPHGRQHAIDTMFRFVSELTDTPDPRCAATPKANSTPELATPDL